MKLRKLYPVGNILHNPLSWSRIFNNIKFHTLHFLVFFSKTTYVCCSVYLYALIVTRITFLHNIHYELTVNKVDICNYHYIHAITPGRLQRSERLWKPTLNLFARKLQIETINHLRLNNIKKNRIWNNYVC